LYSLSRCPELITHNVGLRGIIGGGIRRGEMEGTRREIHRERESMLSRIFIYRASIIR